MVYEFLQGQGLVNFSAATHALDQLFSGIQTVIAIDSPEGMAVLDLMHLNAAEIALRPEPDYELPLYVPEPAARAAISATNSGPFVAHNVRARPRLWDVTLLGSDASKLAWLADTESVETVAERFVDVVRRLAELYAQSGDPTEYGEPGLLAMRALLWRAKIAVLLDEEDLEPVLQARNSLL